MPYTNTQHPSNTRTTVTIVLSIIFGVSIIPTTALGALKYSFENANIPTLYQEVKVKIQKEPATGADAPVFKETDKIYFIEKASGEVDSNLCKPNPCVKRAQCAEVVAGGGSLPPLVTLWSVNVALDNSYALATVTIKNADFSADKAYKMCYLKKDTNAGAAEGAYSAVFEASYTSSDTKTTEFTVGSSIYTTYETDPTDVYAGQGPVSLTITAKAAVGTKANTLAKPAYLIPCPDSGCTTGDLTEKNKDDIAALCSGTGSQGTVTTAVVTGLGTVTLKTTFVAPSTPASFGVCVPYCFKAADCDESAVSWALVNSNTPIKILAANPLSYTINPGSPTTLTFTGTGLKKGDQIRILTPDHVKTGCIFSSTFSSTSTEYTSEVATTCPISDSDTNLVSKFRLNTQLTTLVTGQVCYSRAGSSVWAPVTQATVKAALYFTLENADVPTLYQEVRVKVRRATTEANCKDPVFAATDKVYFIEKTVASGEAKKCKLDTTGVSLWSVDVALDNSYALATVTIKNADFSADKAYKMCYLKKDTNAGAAEGAYSAVFEASYTSSNKKATEFTVRSSIYTTYKTDPTDVYAGQGPVSLTITAKAAVGTKANTLAKPAYLIPCPDSGCTTGDLTEKNKDDIAALCSGTGSQGATTTAVVTGLGTVTLKTTFVAPSTPASYGVCVPYCFKAAVDNCAESEVSWALVNSNTPIKVLPTNTKVPVDTDSKKTVTPGKNTRGVQLQPQKEGDPKEKKGDSAGKKPSTPADGTNTEGKADTPKSDGPTDKDSKAVTKTVNPKPKVLPKGSITVPPVPDVNNSTTISATAISSTIPAVLITSVVFLYLYNW